VTQRVQTAISWSVVVTFGALQAFAGRFYVNPDGVSYLNISDAYTRGDWAGAVNTYWSPLYPLIIGLTRRLFAWPMYWESSIVHTINFAIYLASYACFRLMLRELTQYQREKKTSDSDAYFIDWTRGWELVFAHVVFLWSALFLIRVSLVSPDMLLAAEVYLIVALVLRILRGNSGFSAAILLGALLGVSYLTKAVMFPISFLVIACTGWRMAKGRWSNVHRAVCALSFLAVSSPQIVAMSREVGRPSFGENGRVAYALYVNRYDQYWTGTPPERGKPAHAMKQVLTNPPIFDFATDDPSSSYPFWDKPAYWLQGMKPRLSLSDQMIATQRELGTYASGFATLFLGAVILVLMRLPGRRAGLLGICTVAFGVFVLYALVHTEWRLVAPWGVVLFLGVASSIAFRDDVSSRVGVRAVLAALAVWHLVLTASVVRLALVEISGLGGHTQVHEYWTVASALQQLGLKRGEKVASIGRSSESYWARLAGVQIALEIPPQVSNRYWILDAMGRSKVNKVLTDHGATMIVASYPPAGGGPGWVRLGSSAFYGLPLAVRPGVGDRP
jgi:hypothetical protein